MYDLVTNDSRLFGIHEYGDSEGFPVFYCHGFPGSRMDGMSLNFDSHAKLAGCRIIAVDRPGSGISEYDESRTLLTCADDIVRIADKFNLNRFSVVGFSGGGPYALSIAFKFPDRVESVAFIAGMGPMALKECRNDAAMLVPRSILPLRKLTARILYTATRRTPALISTGMKIFLPKPDVSFLSPTELQLFFIESFRKSARGFLKDAEIYRRPWGFNLSDVKAKVNLWHGSKDRNVSRSSAIRIANELPNCKINFMEGEGHFSLIGKHFTAILRELRQPN